MSEAIYLLDRHATMFAEKDNPPPQSFHENFAQFVKVFKEHNYPVAYLSDGGVVAHYHRKFQDSCSLCLREPLFRRLCWVFVWTLIPAGRAEYLFLSRPSQSNRSECDLCPNFYPR